MLPVYVSYFAGGNERKLSSTLKNALGFVLGFTLMFVAMGALAGFIGGFLRDYQLWVNIVTGLVVVVFGLNYMGVFRLGFFGGKSGKYIKENMGFFSSLVFGVIFSVGWTPCVGVFLGSALMLASQQGKALGGIAMLLAYSLGLGIPFVASALLIDKLKTTFGFIKKNYKVINMVSGLLLVCVGILMITGYMGRLLSILGG